MRGTGKDQNAAGQRANGANESANETMRDGGDGVVGQDVDRDQPAPLVRETNRSARDTEDARRMSHDPEVAGSNPAPAARKCRLEARSLGQRSGFLIVCTRLVRGIWP